MWGWGCVRRVFEVEEAAAEVVLQAGGEAVGGEEGGGGRGEVNVPEGHCGRWEVYRRLGFGWLDGWEMGARGDGSFRWIRGGGCGMCLPGSTDARLVLSQRRRLAGGSWAGPACKVHESREKKKGVEGKPVMRSDRYVKGKRSEGPGSQEVM